MEHKLPNNLKKRWFIKLIPILILITIAIILLSSDIKEYFSFAGLKKHYQILEVYKKQNFLLFIIGYILLYVLIVSCSLPGASIATITGGLLFGPYLGTIIVIFSATIGALLIFLAVKIAFVDILAKSNKHWLKKMERGFNNNAFSYLLSLRLIPIFPFWIVNIVPAILNVRTSVFVSATFLGIMPGSAIYANLGSGLDHIIENNNHINLNVILEPRFLIPLLLLGLLSLAPAIYKKIKRK